MTQPSHRDLNIYQNYLHNLSASEFDVNQPLAHVTSSDAVALENVYRAYYLNKYTSVWSNVCETRLGRGVGTTFHIPLLAWAHGDALATRNLNAIFLFKNYWHYDAKECLFATGLNTLWATWSKHNYKAQQSALTDDMRFIMELDKKLDGKARKVSNTVYQNMRHRVSHDSLHRIMQGDWSAPLLYTEEQRQEVFQLVEMLQQTEDPLLQEVLVSTMERIVHSDALKDVRHTEIPLHI